MTGNARLAAQGASLTSELQAEGERRLEREDPLLHGLLNREVERQNRVLAMVAASSIADPSVLACGGSAVMNVTAEGYPGKRYHAGCEVVDEIERLAIQRACEAFQARYANVQPHSGSSANFVLLFSLLRPGDKVLGLELDSGGHLTHGARASASGQYFQGIPYGLDGSGRIDYDAVQQLAQAHRPKLIVCGASAHPRAIDFARFRAIADSVQAYLLADISHISGLVVSGHHQSPVDHAHFTTTSTYKQLCGPRGGLILMGRDHDAPLVGGRGTLSQAVQRGVFPYFQGTPDLSNVAAKARALHRAQSDEFAATCALIVADAKALADELSGRGFRVVTGGTDNHIVLLDVLASRGVTGAVAEKALESCGIIVNRNKIPGDAKPALITSGLRLGTNSLATRGMQPSDMAECAELICDVLGSVRVVSDTIHELPTDLLALYRRRTEALASRFPIPGYPVR